MYRLDRLTHYLHRSRPSGLTALEINYFVSQFAAGMVGSFGVLFIFQLGESLKQGLLFIFLFFSFQRLVVGLSTPLVGWAYTKIGYRLMMMAGLLALALKLWLFTMVKPGIFWPLVPALFFGGLTIPGYYLGFHALFLDDNVDNKLGQQIGALAMLSRLATVVSPLLAGLLVQQLGFPAMFSVAVVLLFVSVVPLFIMPRHQRHVEHYSLSRVLETLRRETRLSGSIIGWHLENGIQAFFWPVYLFLILGSYTTFGAVTSAVMGLSSLAVYYSGRVYDQRPLRRIFPAAAGLVSVTWLLRWLANTPIPTVTADSLNRLISPLWWMKIRRQELMIGEKIDSLNFAVVHEILVTIGLLISLLASYLLLLTSNNTWLWLMIPALAGIGLSTWLVKD